MANFHTKPNGVCLPECVWERFAAELVQTRAGAAKRIATSG